MDRWTRAERVTRPRHSRAWPRGRTYEPLAEAHEWRKPPSGACAASCHLDGRELLAPSRAGGRSLPTAATVPTCVPMPEAPPVRALPRLVQRRDVVDRRPVGPAAAPPTPRTAPRSSGGRKLARTGAQQVAGALDVARRADARVDRPGSPKRTCASPDAPEVPWLAVVRAGGRVAHAAQLADHVVHRRGARAPHDGAHVRQRRGAHQSR